MTHKELLGKILEHVGKELQDPASSLAKSISVSEEQLFALVRFARIVTSPAVQVMYIQDVAERLGRSVKTIQGWIAAGIIRHGHKRIGDTRTFWYASEIDEDARWLVKHGYIGENRNKVERLMERCRRFLRFGDC